MQLIQCRARYLEGPYSNLSSVVGNTVRLFTQLKITQTNPAFRAPFSPHSFSEMGAPRNIRHATKKYAENINKRGDVSLKAPSKEELLDNGEGSRLGKIALALLMFVVFGSMITPIIQKIGSGPVF